MIRGWLFLSLIVSPVLAAPVRDTGREQFPAQVENGRVQTGFLDLGAYFNNPNSAASARPNGSGTALFNYHGYMADSIDGDTLQFLGEGLFLTDRDTSNSLKPVSADYLLGVASRLDHLRLQLDREEALTMRGSRGGWRNWDVRGSILFGSEDSGQNGSGQGFSSRSRSRVTSWSGALMVGYYMHPGGTPSRPDGSGRAQWHYEATLQSNLMEGRLLLRTDADMLTDKYSRRGLPSDLDLDLGVGTSYQGGEIMLHRRSREAIGSPGYGLYYLITMSARFDSRKYLSGN